MHFAHVFIMNPIQANWKRFWNFTII